MLVFIVVLLIVIEMKGIDHEYDYEHEQDQEHQQDEL
jgi:hypothetical protein